MEVRNIFKRKKYTLKFEKAYQATGWSSWEEVTDACLLATLLKLQEKYEFEIISYQFKECFSVSYITIKCDKKDKQTIFMEYCMMLNKRITKCSVK